MAKAWKVSVAEIARVCHEANRAYCLALGDKSQAPWQEAPQWQKDSAIAGVEYHRDELQRGVLPSPAESHEKWLALKLREGWRFGPVKDPAKKEHPCCVPYRDLPETQRFKDELFGGIVLVFYNAGLIKGTK